ncbi:lipid A deacylase LpxR family protein [Verrucomicrobiaceae bacterium R5-34]|nr:lipid A deacylase LpxR family protein [Verrucomicrobiaceae bacterium R5-34]
MKLRPMIQPAAAGVLALLSQPLLAQSESVSTTTGEIIEPVSADLIGGIDPHFQLEGPIATADAGYLTFFLDNDLFGGTDENYTNGARLSWITEGKPVIDIPFVQDNLHRFSGGSESLNWMRKIWGFRHPAQIEYSYGFALSQLMFTPATREALVPPEGERPYAGWAGLGFSLHARDAHAQNSVEIAIGVVGPASYAQETQDFIHDLRDFDKFQGWDSQIPNEITLNLYFNQRRRIESLHKIQLPMDLKVDGFTETGYALGNFRTDARIGFLVRAGWNLPVEFADPRLSATAHTQRLYSGAGNSNKWSLYGLLGAQATGVLHDITLDGPLFRNYDTNVDREPFVAELYAGFGVRYSDLEFSYVHTYRTKTFETQDNNQSFGSLAIRLRF